MNFKKWTTMAVVSALCVTLILAGCSKGSGSQAASETPQGSTSVSPSDSVSPSASASETANTFVLGSEPLKFSFYGHYDWYNMQPWGEDPASKWIQDNKKVTVEAISAGGAPEQKLNTMIASGELPDVIFLERGADVERLRAAGKLVALDEYLDKYPNLKKWIDPQALSMLRSEDGKLYQFPNWYTKYPQGNGGYMINKQIYKELGSPKLETFDDLYAYLKQVKAKYPNVIPYETTIVGQGIDLMYSGFGEDHPLMYIAPEGGIKGIPDGTQFKSMFTDPVYRETMKYASKLFREKLMTQDALTQTLDQVREKMTTGRVAVIGAFNVMGIGGQGTLALRDKVTDEKAKNDAGYELIWPLHKEGVDKNKVWPTQYDVLGWNVNVITTSAKNPEGIFAYLDWLTGEEGQRTMTWGPEGTYWQGTFENGAPKFTPKFFEDEKEYNRLYMIWDSFTWAGNSSYFNITKEEVGNQTPPELQAKMAPPQPKYNLETAFNATQFVNLDPPANTEEAVIAQKINDIYKEARAKAIFAKSDQEVDSILDKAQSDAEKAGYDKLLKFKAERWQQNLKKLNGN